VPQRETGATKELVTPRLSGPNFSFVTYTPEGSGPSPDTWTGWTVNKHTAPTWAASKGNRCAPDRNTCC
jgi:hypothetical protein